MVSDLDDPDVCDFCDLSMDEDEELVELNVGSPPSPKPIRAEATEKLKRYDSFDGSAYGRALLGALDGLRCADVSRMSAVEEVEFVGGDASVVDMSTDFVTQFETTRRDDMVAVRVKIQPELERYTPDAMVCEDCADELRDL